MSRLSNLTFGDADHLPGAEALNGLTDAWHTNSLLATGEGDTSSVARLRDYPEAVVRIQHTEYGADEIALGVVAQTGIRHFKQMQEAGLRIPPQRFVIAPSVFAGPSIWRGYTVPRSQWSSGTRFTLGNLQSLTLVTLYCMT